METRWEFIKNDYSYTERNFGVNAEILHSMKADVIIKLLKILIFS